MKRATVITALLVAATAGCQTSEGSTPRRPGPTASASPTEAATPTVDPATGKLLKMEPLSFRVPKGYKAGLDFGGLVGSGFLGLESVTATTFHHILVGTPSADTDEMARLARKDSLWEGKKPRRLPDVVVDGVSMFQLTASSHCCGLTSTEYGADLSNQTVGITFELKGSRAHRQEVIDSVLATVEWAEN